MPFSTLPFTYALPASTLPFTYALPAAIFALAFAPIPLSPRMIGPASLRPVLITKSRALLTGFWSFATIERIFSPMPPMPRTLAMKPIRIGTI